MHLHQAQTGCKATWQKQTQFAATCLMWVSIDHDENNMKVAEQRLRYLLFLKNTFKPSIHCGAVLSAAVRETMLIIVSYSVTTQGGCLLCFLYCYTDGKNLKHKSHQTLGFRLLPSGVTTVDHLSHQPSAYCPTLHPSIFCGLPLFLLPDTFIFNILFLIYPVSSTFPL